MRCGLMVGLMLALGSLGQAGEPVLELKVGDECYVGCPVAHNDDVCWLAHPDGQLSQVALLSVSSFRKVGEEFQRLTPVAARSHLREELGREWEIVGTGHYLVCAKAGRGRAYADHFEDLYRSFRSYFSRRGFRLPEPEFPLIAVVFANRGEFADHCRVDGMPFVPGLRGYYHRITNRICLYESDDDSVSLKATRAVSADVATAASAKVRAERRVSEAIDASIQAGLKDTIVHEATHQVAYNLGLHSRLGRTPRWIVEGLATMFEAEGTRQNTGGRHARERVNDERFWWFTKSRQGDRPPAALTNFVATEEAFAAAPLDFYAQAWALTFFLAETRPREYAEYLRGVASRNPLEDYSAEQRLKDFQSSFGSDLSRLEVDLLRFMDELGT